MYLSTLGLRGIKKKKEEQHGYKRVEGYLRRADLRRVDPPMDHHRSLDIGLL